MPPLSTSRILPLAYFGRRNFSFLCLDTSVSLFLSPFFPQCNPLPDLREDAGVSGMDSVRSSAPASGQPAGDATSRTSGGGANAQYTTRTSRSAAAQDPQAQDADGDEAIGSDCVRIGDIVFLHGVDVVGLLFADGFVDESCWIGRHEGAMSDNDHELIMDSLFVVCVRNFHINVEKSRQADARMGNLHDMSYSEALTAKAQMEQLRRAVDEERAANELETRRSLGAVVRYGDGIELQHLRSGKMLSLRRDAVQPHAAGGDQSPEFAGREATFDVVVTDLESENQHFTVHPRFRIQNLSDPLRYGECSSIARACCKEGKCVHSQVHGGAC